MIFVTGDTHGDMDFAKMEVLATRTPPLTRNDYVIIAGDFGGIWSEQTLERDLKPYEELPYTVLFVDGNHENFELLNAYPVSEWKGGKVHVIKPNILHLMRGQVYEIEGKTFFTFGGATSTDKFFRKAYVSWWPEETPTDDDMVEAIENLKKVGNKVNYIVTHTIDEKGLYYPPLKRGSFQFDSFPENRLFSYFEDTVAYDHWYFGHYHLDGNLTDKKRVLYNDIVKLNV